MLQELEIKALKGKSKTSRLKIKPDFEREPLKNLIGYASDFPVRKRLIN